MAKSAKVGIASAHVLVVAFVLAAMSAIAPQIAAAQDSRTDWPSYNRTLASDRYSPLDEINRDNVAKLHQLCVYDLGFQTEFEPGPLVIGRTLYATSEMDIVAIDAGTCQEKWRTHEDIQLPYRHFPTNRGAAFLDGKLFRGTQDGRVFAYDAENGKKLWETKILHMRGESVPAAPIAWNGMVFVGNAGGDQKGVKGRMYGLDAATGKVMWQTYLVPAQGEPGAGPEEAVAAPTWGNTEDVPITGGATWTSYTLDTERELLYVPGGNPAPDFNKKLRPGANLFAGSVVVLDAKTGDYRQHFSLVPQDFHDWDVSAAPALITTKGGKHLLADAGKNGLLYGIDLASGKHLFETPITTRWHTTAPLSDKGTRFCPGAGGGTEWNGPAYSPQTNLIYDGTVDRCSTVKSVEDDDAVKATPTGMAWTGAIQDAPFGTKDPTWSGWLYATDADTGKVKWRYHAAAPVASGITPTQGGLVFAGDMNGNAFAFDAATGKQLWHVQLDGAPGGGLITYAIEGHQRVAIVSGTNSPTLDLSPKGNAKIIIFGL